MPLAITPTRRERLGAFLRESLTRTQRQRDERVSQWRRFLDRYEAKTVPKNIPFFGASSIHAPIVPITFDAVKARVMNALFADSRFIVGEALDEAPIGTITNPKDGSPVTWRDVAELLEAYLLYETSHAGDIDFRAAVDELFDEVGLLGTGIIKTVWDVQTTREYLEDGTPVEHTLYNNIRLLVPSLEDIFVPPGYPDLSRIPFLTQRYLLRGSELLARTTQSGWDSAAVKRYLADKSKHLARPTDLEEAQDELEKVSQDPTSQYGEFQVAETWLRFDLDGTGRESRIVVDHAFDDPTVIFRIIPWPYEHGDMPFALARYIKRRKRFYGMGIPERLESLDEGISTTLNQMIDNQSLANTRMWSVDEGSKAMQALDRIWPGKKIPRSSKDDIIPLQMGEIYPSMFETHNILQAYAEKVSKLSDYNLGRESQAMGRQSTATATMALLQESGQYFDNITRDLRLCLNIVLQQWLDLLVQYKPFERIAQVLGQEKATLLLAALSLPPGSLRKRISLRVSFSSTAATRELVRQEEMAKWQLLQQYYQSLIQGAQLRFSGIPMPMTMLLDDIAADAELRMKRLLEAYGDSYTSTTLPSWKRIMNNVPPVPGPAPLGLGQPQGPPGQPGMAPPPGAPPGPSPFAQQGLGTPLPPMGLPSPGTSRKNGGTGEGPDLA